MKKLLIIIVVIVATTFSSFAWRGGYLRSINGEEWYQRYLPSAYSFYYVLTAHRDIPNYNQPVFSEATFIVTYDGGRTFKNYKYRSEVYGYQEKTVQGPFYSNSNIFREVWLHVGTAANYGDWSEAYCYW